MSFAPKEEPIQYRQFENDKRMEFSKKFENPEKNTNFNNTSLVN